MIEGMSTLLARGANAGKWYALALEWVVVGIHRGQEDHQT